MSDPTTTTPPTYDELAGLVVGETQAALNGMMETLQRYAANPHQWPHMAATCHFYGQKLAEHAREMGEALAAYAVAHPELEPDESGVPVQFLSIVSEHAAFWEDSDGAVDGTAESYAVQVGKVHGRPELTDRAVDLMPVFNELGLDTSSMVSPVVVFQYFTGSLVADRPHAARVLIGGLDLTKHVDAIERVLEHFGIVPVAPRYWPPVPALIGTSFLSLPGGVYDAFGRPLDGPTEDELAARAGRGMV